MWDGIIGGALGLIGQERANHANAKAVAEANATQMAFQERMSSTAHQREVQDLRAAGLNPMLSGMGGSGAPGAAGSANAAVMENSLEKGVTSGLDAMRYRKELKQVDSQTALNQVAEKTQATQQVANLSSAKAAAANADKATQEAQSVSLGNKAAKAQLPAILSQAKADKQTSDFNQKAATYDSFAKRVLDGIGGLGSAINNIFRGGGARPKLNNEYSGGTKGRY